MRDLALSVLTEACHTLEHAALSAPALHETYQALHPLGHEGAARAGVDLGFLVRAFALGGAPLLSAARVVVRAVDAPLYPHVTPLDDGVQLVVEDGPHAAGDAAMLLCGLDVECAKIARQLGPGPAPGFDTAAALLGVDVRGAFDDEAQGRAFLAALAGASPQRSFGLMPRRGALPVETPLERPAILVVGGAAHELFSPYVRRLGPRLTALGGDPYEGMSVLFTEAPDCADERRAVEQQDGIVPRGGGLLVRTDRLRKDAVDPRAARTLTALARARCDILLGPTHPAALRALLPGLGGPVIGVVAIAPGLGFGPAVGAPTLLGSSRAGAPWVRLAASPLPVEALPANQQVPSLAVASDGRGYHTGLYDIVATIHEAMASGALPADAPVAALLHRAHDRAAQHEATLTALAQAPTPR